jgi:hypothetical protein
LLEVVVLEGSTAEGVVLDEEDGRVDGEPVGEDDEERIEGILERVVTDFGKDDVFEMEGREKKGQYNEEKDDDRDSEEEGRRKEERSEGGETRTDDGADNAEEETRNHLEVLAERLERKREGVDVGDVVGDDGEGEDDKEEASEAAHGTDERSGEETSKPAGFAHLSPGGLVDEGGHHESSEALDEDDYGRGEALVCRKVKKAKDRDFFRGERATYEGS